MSHPGATELSGCAQNASRFGWPLREEAGLYLLQALSLRWFLFSQSGLSAGLNDQPEPVWHHPGRRPGGQWATSTRGEALPLGLHGRQLPCAQGSAGQRLRGAGSCNLEVESLLAWFSGTCRQFMLWIPESVLLFPDGLSSVAAGDIHTAPNVPLVGSVVKNSGSEF